ncbi:MAG: ATP-binding protein [Thermoleophilaceae bacterium]
MSHSVAAYSTAGACAVCGVPLPGDAKLDALPEPEVAISRSMRAGLAAPADARRAVGSLPLLEPAREKVGLVVSELVTNSIRHAGLGAGDPIGLDVTTRNGQVRIAVHDAGPGFDPDGKNGERPAIGGFGLSIIAALSDEWGVDRANGCTVWCAVPA